ncbi:hypothetical protein B9J93_18150 [Vibrio sp. V17_P4S1T151]|uniref:radical SAM protein n=1 Tax=unclassified Vibrio TaxID=2614977 RepID=UPI000B8E72A1|nr:MULTISPECIES: radical SAM protein [unclassified Vibrio]OXX42296.1 hypothetical protein B9J93_18150 [Vibrio sp. V17_P4S1T151]OXX64712.1 hypothetical protein B9J89_02265 [Vibrio sp. V15_P4S5T153]
MKQPLLFINVTRQCNINCPRCYLTIEQRTRKECIPFEYIDKALSDPFFLGDDIEPIIAWEGGELTLVGQHVLRDYMQRVRDKFPKVRQTMVTNAYNTPNWLIDLCREYMDNHFEVTYSMGHKFTLDGSSEKYQERFLRSIQKARKAGMSVTVNVELNKETFEAGAGALVEIMRKSDAKIWEFDASVQFDKFLESPLYNHMMYPVLPLSINYDQFSSYLIELVDKYGHELQEMGIQSSILWHSQTQAKSQFFNVKNSDMMFTLNPDGTVVTDVLWCDMGAMILGNIKDQKISDFMDHPIRRKHSRWENKLRCKSCVNCEYYHSCQGGPSHVPVYDGVTNECAGAKKLYQFMEKYKGPYDSENQMFDPVK